MRLLCANHEDKECMRLAYILIPNKDEFLAWVWADNKGVKKCGLDYVSGASAERITYLILGHTWWGKEEDIRKKHETLGNYLWSLYKNELK